RNRYLQDRKLSETCSGARRSHGGAARMASADAVSIPRKLGVRELAESGSSPLSIAADHATPYSSHCAKAGHHETNRLAYFSSHLFDAASIYWCGTEDHAGTAASFDDSSHARYVHAGSDNRETECARSSGRAIVPGKNAGNVSSAWTNAVSCTYS